MGLAEILSSTQFSDESVARCTKVVRWVFKSNVVQQSSRLSDSIPRPEYGHMHE